MPVDKEFEFRKLRIGIKKAVLDRKQGSWSRALWYGGQSYYACAAAYVTGKAVSSGPGTLAAPVVKVVATAAGAAVFVPPIAIAGAGFIVGQLANAGFPKVVEKVRAASRWLRGLDQGPDATTTLDADFKKLEGETIPVIDRNVKKLDDAIRDANKKVEQLRVGTAKPAQSIDLDDLAARSETALRAVYEVGYYHAKVTGLVVTLAEAVQSLSAELKKIDEPLARQEEWVESIAKEVLGNCLATAEFHGGGGPKVPPPLPPKR